jgi:magnesium chelatase family protein
MTNKEVREYCTIPQDALHLLRIATEQYHLSARSYTRILKVARTIADLAASDNISTEHVAEALQFRSK